jgi:hypothetical protein
MNEGFSLFPQVKALTAVSAAFMNGKIGCGKKGYGTPNTLHCIPQNLLSQLYQRADMASQVRHGTLKSQKQDSTLHLSLYKLTKGH